MIYVIRIGFSIFFFFAAICFMVFGPINSAYFSIFPCYKIQTRALTIVIIAIYQVTHRTYIRALNKSIF